jgi:nucleoside-diphosphate-sugar epimerase
MEIVTQLSPGNQNIDFLYIEDVIEGITSAIQALSSNATQPYKTYGLYSGQPVTILELVDLLEDISPIHPFVRFGALCHRDREVMQPVYIERLPNWTPRIKLKDGLRKIWGTEAL